MAVTGYQVRQAGAVVATIGVATSYTLNGLNPSTTYTLTGYVFNPSAANTATATITAASTRYVRLNVTGNTGWPAGQLSEIEVYAS